MHFLIKTTTSALTTALVVRVSKRAKSEQSAHLPDDVGHHDVAAAAADPADDGCVQRYAQARRHADAHPPQRQPRVRAHLPRKNTHWSFYYDRRSAQKLRFTLDLAICEKISSKFILDLHFCHFL